MTLRDYFVECICDAVITHILWIFVFFSCAVVCASWLPVLSPGKLQYLLFCCFCLLLWVSIYLFYLLLCLDFYCSCLLLWVAAHFCYPLLCSFFGCYCLLVWFFILGHCTLQLRSEPELTEIFNWALWALWKSLMSRHFLTVCLSTCVTYDPFPIRLLRLLRALDCS